MTPNPQEEDLDGTQPDGPPLDDGDAARQVAHVTGMTPEAARAFASYHSGRYAAFRRSP
jgi:hypothetical protein